MNRKQYDQAYFDTWYRQRGIGAGAALQRKIALAVAMAEFHLERPLRSVLDVGCGEGSWQLPLHKLRPKLRYLGVDSSEYAVARFGRRRNLHHLKFEDLPALGGSEPFDLVVCTDVLHYLPEPVLDRGLAAFPLLCRGVLFAETFCRGDVIEGDLKMYRRPARFYREKLRDAGFLACGSHLYLAPALHDGLCALETCAEPG